MLATKSPKRANVCRLGSQQNSRQTKKEQDHWQRERMRTRGVTVCAVLAALRSLRSAAQPQHHALMYA